MYYCEKCRVKNEWPNAFVRSSGKCECCGESAVCWDRPSSSLPRIERPVENNVAAQAGDEPMRTLDERRAEHEAEAMRINAGRKPKFGDWMRNPWAGESNPQRDGMFVQSKRVTGKFNPGLWYEMTNGEGEFWSSNGKVLFFIDSPRATADVERVMMECLIALSIGYTLTNDDGDEVCADCDVDHASSEDHSPGCLVLRARAARAQLAAIATTKPGA